MLLYIVMASSGCLIHLPSYLTRDFLKTNFTIFKSCKVIVANGDDVKYMLHCMESISKFRQYDTHYTFLDRHRYSILTNVIDIEETEVINVHPSSYFLVSLCPVFTYIRKRKKSETVNYRKGAMALW